MLHIDNLDTSVMLFSGETVKIKDIKVGYQLMGDDSNPRNVLSVYSGKYPMYKITQTNGESYIVNESHILSLKQYGSKIIHDISVKDILQLPKSQRDNLKGFKVGCDFKSSHLPVDPYKLGYFLGNTDIAISASDVEMSTFINDNNLLKDRHIPRSCLINDKNTRLDLLSGFIDSVGYYNKRMNCYEFVNIPTNLQFDLIFLCRSLGFYIQDVYDKNTNRCFLSGTQIDTRNKNTYLSHETDDILTDIKIVPIGIGDYCGFEIDGNHRFLLSDFTVTHL